MGCFQPLHALLLNANMVKRAAPWCDVLIIVVACGLQHHESSKMFVRKI
jgi:hypothetical protein